MSKETYFTSVNLQSKSQNFLDYVAGYRKTHVNQVFEPGLAALLVLDMQNYFLDPRSHAFIPSSSAIIPGIRSLINVFKSKDRPVIFTRHVNSAQQEGMMGKWWLDEIKPDTFESCIIDAFDLAGAAIIEKQHYDAFFATTLAEFCNTNQVKQIVVTGVMTHLCCESTARSAFMHGYEVFFTIDGTATYNERHHRAALLNLAHGFALPVLVEELLDDFAT